MGHRQLQNPAPESSPEQKPSETSAATEFSPERKVTESSGSAADLRPDQLRGLDALLKGATHAGAGTAAGVTDRTIRNWLVEPGFAAVYRGAKEALWKEAMGLLNAATSRAVQALTNAMEQDRNIGAGVRAASIVLRESGRAIEVESILDRVGELEGLLQDAIAVNHPGRGEVDSRKDPSSYPPLYGSYPAGVAAARESEADRDLAESGPEGDEDYGPGFAPGHHPAEDLDPIPA